MKFLIILSLFLIVISTQAKASCTEYTRQIKAKCLSTGSPLDCHHLHRVMAKTSSCKRSEEERFSFSLVQKYCSYYFDRRNETIDCENAVNKYVNTYSRMKRTASK